MNGRPQASDSFHSTDEEYTEKLGSPKELTIRFPLSDPEASFKTGLECWGANGTLKCWCGDTVTAHRLQNNGTILETPCTYTECNQYKQGNCSAIGRLKFEIPELGVGLFQLDTKSWHSINSLAGALSVYNPIPVGLLFKLFMVKKKGPKGVFNVLQLKALSSFTQDTEEV